MKNLNLGKQLTREEQKQIQGGSYWTYTCGDGRTSAFYYSTPQEALYGSQARCDGSGATFKKVELI